MSLPGVHAFCVIPVFKSRVKFYPIQGNFSSLFIFSFRKKFAFLWLQIANSGRRSSVLQSLSLRPLLREAEEAGEGLHNNRSGPWHA